MNEKEQILKELEPLFEKAEKEGLWFYYNNYDLWFTPEKLKENHKNDKFVWGTNNWELKNPTEKIKDLMNKKNNYKNLIFEIEKEIYDTQNIILNMEG